MKDKKRRTASGPWGRISIAAGNWEERYEREQSSPMRTEAKMHTSETLEEVETGEGLGGTE